jgi:hypothetical protein
MCDKKLTSLHPLGAIKTLFEVFSSADEVDVRVVKQLVASVSVIVSLLPNIYVNLFTEDPALAYVDIVVKVASLLSKTSHCNNGNSLGNQPTVFDCIESCLVSNLCNTNELCSQIIGDVWFLLVKNSDSDLRDRHTQLVADLVRWQCWLFNYG